MNNSQRTPPTETPVSIEEIARDLYEYLQDNNDGVCAKGSVTGWVWVRCIDGDWQGVRYSSSDDRKRSYVEGTVMSEESVMRWLINNPVNLIPSAEAYKWDPASRTVWEDADRQDVFTGHDRCAWCGESERDRELTGYDTVEDGTCLLCGECEGSWARSGELVQETAG